MGDQMGSSVVKVLKGRAGVDGNHCADQGDLKPRASDLINCLSSEALVEAPFS